MDKDYLIIYNRSEGFNYDFLETENELNSVIDWCKKYKYQIMFAGKIIVTKEFIG